MRMRLILLLAVIFFTMFLMEVNADPGDYLVDIKDVLVKSEETMIAYNPPEILQSEWPPCL